MSRAADDSSTSRQQTTAERDRAARDGLLSLGALAAGFGFALPGFAQTAAGTPPETVLAPITAHASAEFEDKQSVQAVTTGIGRGTQDIRDLPQSLNVMTEKLLDDRKVDSLNQALRLTAGVTFSAAENGTQPDVFIRGFSVAQVGDLLIDGMKDPSQYERDTFNYDRIEVLRGSASMIFGRGSTGGVVNQVNKKPLLADLRELNATLGTGRYGRATADLNLRTGEHSALRVNGMFTRADNYGASIDKAGLAPSFGVGLGTRHEFTGSLFYLKTDDVPKNGVPYLLLQQFPGAVDGNSFYGAASDYNRGEARYGVLQSRLRFDHGGQLSTQLRTGTFDRALWLSVVRLPAGTGTVERGTVLTRVGLTPRKDRYRGTYLQSDYSLSADWLGMKHSLLAGLDAARETADRFVSANVGANLAKGSTTLGTSDDGYRASVSPTWTPGNDYVSRNAGLFMQDLVEFVPHWKLLFGLREDYIKGEYHNLVNNVSILATMEDAVASQRYGLLYQPVEQLSFHLAYGTSFNTSGDTYQFTGVLATAANTPPEKSRNFELGAKAGWFNGNLSTRLAIFRTEKYNERTTDADVVSQVYLLSGKRHSAGWELEVAGRPMDKVEVYVSYAFIPTSSIDEAGQSAAAQATVGQAFGLLPRQSGSAWVTWQATAKMRIGMGATGASRNYSINGTTPTRGAFAPGYLVYDALAEYRFTPALSLQLNGSNLANATYSSELYRGHAILAPGRNVKLTLGYTFQGQ